MSEYEKEPQEMDESIKELQNMPETTSAAEACAIYQNLVKRIKFEESKKELASLGKLESMKAAAAALNEAIANTTSNPERYKKLTQEIEQLEALKPFAERADSYMANLTWIGKLREKALWSINKLRYKIGKWGKSGKQ